ncbi:MAG: carbohydrate ABC transporter permease, partial [Nitrososphaerota archaeon]
AAAVDGASVFRIWWQVILPLCRPALAALATLEFTWKWNDYLWVITLIQSTDNATVTLGLSGLRGEFVTNWNLITAASLLAAIPTVIIYFVLQRYFIGGLFVGSNK